MKKGLYTALVTPLNEDKTINYSCLKKLIDFQIESGVAGIVILGSTGESQMLSFDDKLTLIEKVTSYVKKRTLVIVGITASDINDVIFLGLFAKKRGADALLISNPPYVKGNKNGIFKYFTYLAKCINHPIIIYNVPSRTAYNIDSDVIIELSKNSNIIGVKQASPDLLEMEKIINKTSDFLVFTGNDENILESIFLGGDGVISVLSNIVPKELSKVVSLALSRNQTAFPLFSKYQHLISLLFIEANPIPVKFALREMGYNVGGYLLPLDELEPENKNLLTLALKELNLC